jgi:hypothetical protein
MAQPVRNNSGHAVVAALAEMKRVGQKIACFTAYDIGFAVLVIPCRNTGLSEGARC